MGERKILTRKIAEQFLNDDESLDLFQFTAIEDQAAKKLAGYPGGLYLDGLMTLSETSAKYLGNEFVGTSLSFGRIEQISDAVIASLSRFNGDLSFCSLDNLTESAAASLANHNGSTLSLGGLTSISDQVAECLSKHRGDLLLDGINILSDAAAKSFGRHKGKLEFGNLTRISKSAAEDLIQHVGELSLNLSGVWCDSGEQVTFTLRQHPSLGIQPLNGSRFVSLLKARLVEFGETYELTEVADGVSYTWFEHGGNYGDDWQECFRFLQKAAGRIFWDVDEGQLDVEPSDAVPSHRFYFIGMPSDVERTILSGLKQLSDEAAAYLSDYEGNLPLNELTSLSEEAAKHLAKHQGRISMERLTSISETAAMHLSNHSAELSVPLENIPERAARILRAHRHLVSLNKSTP